MSSNTSTMVNNPYTIESELNCLINDRLNWKTGKAYTDINLEEFNNKMKETYKYLNSASPMLFEKACSGFMDNKTNLNMMRNMLKLSQNIYDGKCKQADADKYLGQQLANQYVNPIIEKLDKDNKNP